MEKTVNPDVTTRKAEGKGTKGKGKSKGRRADTGATGQATKPLTRPQVFAKILKQVKGQPVTRKRLGSMLNEQYGSNDQQNQFWAGNYVGLLLAMGAMERVDGVQVVYTGKRGA